VTGLVGAGRRSTAAGEIVLVIDSSGSVSAETFTRFLQQAQDILDEVRPLAIHVLSVSHEVCDYAELRAGDTVPDRLNGGGGTLFQPAFDFIAERGIQPEVLVYLTDGLSGDLRQLVAPDYPVLWLSTYLRPNNYPFGDVVLVDSF
jgi:predicted metal-dependent peptidase